MVVPDASSSYYYLVTNYFKPETLFRGAWSVNVSHISIIGGNSLIVSTKAHSDGNSMFEYIFLSAVVKLLSRVRESSSPFRKGGHFFIFPPFMYKTADGSSVSSFAGCI